MKLDESDPRNATLLAHLREREGPRFDPRPILSPADHPDPYMEAGSHPDIVERVWDRLGDALPTDCRALVLGRPALVEPTRGIVLALAYGTAYAIRVPDEKLEDALARGCRAEERWSGGGATRAEQAFGRGWVFGGWLDDEAEWLAESLADA